MASTPLRPVSRQRFALRKLVWVGPLTIVVAALVNVVIRSVAVAFFGVPAGFTYLQAPVVIGSTIVFLLLALLAFVLVGRFARRQQKDRSEEHTSELQSHSDLVCRLLLEKKKKILGRFLRGSTASLR